MTWCIIRFNNVLKGRFMKKKGFFIQLKTEDGVGTSSAKGGDANEGAEKIPTLVWHPDEHRELGLTEARSRGRKKCGSHKERDNKT